MYRAALGAGVDFAFITADHDCRNFPAAMFTRFRVYVTACNTGEDVGTLEPTAPRFLVEVVGPRRLLAVAAEIAAIEGLGDDDDQCEERLSSVLNSASSRGNCSGMAFTLGSHRLPPRCSCFVSV